MKKLNFKEFKEELSKIDIDFFFVSSSFEDRCLVISKQIYNLNLTVKVLYNSNESPQIIQNSIKIEELFKENVQRIELNTDNPVNNYQKILDLINNVIDNKSLPNLLIDITTFTHETLLIMLRLLTFYKDKLGKVFVSYVGAKEYSYNEPDDNQKWLSKGIKEIRTIIGYPGFSDPTKENHLLVLFGFESDRTKKIIDEFQYEHISLGFASVEESIQPNHQKINANRHRSLVEEYDANIFEFSLIDVYTVKKSILEYLKAEKFDKMNTVIAPMNNKVSTIGAGLAAIENDSIQLTYAQANIYNVEGYSIANDDIYFCQLEL